MTTKKIISLCAATMLALFALAGCSGPSDEEAVRARVSAEFDAIKSIDDASLDELAENSGFGEFAAFGIEPREFAASYLSGFDYRIDNVTVDGDTAQATVTLTCKSVKEFGDRFNEEVEALAADEAVANMTEEEANQKIGDISMEIMTSLQPVDMPTLTIEFARVNGAWEPTDSGEQAIANAFFNH